MSRDEAWLTPLPGQASRLWVFGSRMTIMLISTIGKVWIGWFNKPEVHKKHLLFDAIDKREPSRPLITACNHYSMVDDPLLAYMLTWRQLMSLDRLRWLLGAKDICNKTFRHSLFFQLGKVLPVERGGGVYQYGMDFCVDRLNDGKWVAIYPEGKINMQQENMRLKWGIGRLVADSQVCPLVVPYWHVGMEEVLPTVKPYTLQTGKFVTVLFGESMDFTEELKCLREQNKTQEEIRKYITDRVQEEFAQLKLEAERLHKLRTKSNTVSTNSS